MMRILFTAIAMLAATILPAFAQFSLPRAEVQLSIDCDDCPTMVTLPNGLRMSQAHVTRAQFEVFSKETGYTRTTWGCSWKGPPFAQKPEEPAVCVSHVDAEHYLEWLSARSGVAYRLPTIDEYRYAASGGQASNYWWGQDIGEGRANCTGCGSAFDGIGTSPAGYFQPNPFGLLDAVGNAWQWTSDCQDAACGAYFLIGGGWTSPPADLRLTKTIWNDAPIPFQSYGLRVVADVSP
jgi:formylglycine-generating enzyme required for sulfatase activity